MNSFFYQQGCCPELESFSHIVELGNKRNSAIQLNSLQETTSDSLRLYHIIDGRFDWDIHGQQCTLYPGDTAVVLPGQRFSSTKGYLEIGAFSWLYINAKYTEDGGLTLGKWSGLSEREKFVIGKILMGAQQGIVSKVTEIARIFNTLVTELQAHEIGYVTRVNQLLDEVIVTVTRHMTRKTNFARDFPKTFLELEQKLRSDLSHQWTVEEMAASVGMGTTLFNEKVKSFSGFSALNYLINIRISEAIKMLRRPDLNITDIALDTGFYSSQHFATTFKKLTGYTPSGFRKKNIQKH
jgi:AraC-like DNA-binding protein